MSAGAYGFSGNRPLNMMQVRRLRANTELIVSVLDHIFDKAVKNLPHQEFRSYVQSVKDKAEKCRRILRIIERFSVDSFYKFVDSFRNESELLRQLVDSQGE